MSPPVVERMRERAAAVRTRAAVRAWQYRQRHLAAGVWFRLRRVLANAERAYAIADAEADRLVAEGCRPEPCGAELSPEKTLVFVDPSQLERLASRREIRVGLGPEFLAATSVALVAFEGIPER